MACGEIVAQGSGCYPTIQSRGCCTQAVWPPAEQYWFNLRFIANALGPFLTGGSGGGGHNAFIGGDAVTIPDPGPVPQFWSQGSGYGYGGYSGGGGGFAWNVRNGNPHGGPGQTGEMDVVIQ